jgi:integrase
MLGRPPASIPADPRLLLRRLREIAPESAGISRKRAKNIRWLVRVAFRLTQAMRPGRQPQPLCANWQVLCDRILNKARRMQLLQLLRYFSERGIKPEMVSNEHADAFLKTLREGSLLKDPETAWRETVWYWNRCLEEVPGWPCLTLNFVSRQITYSLPWSAFPSSLKADIDSYLDRLSATEFADDVPLRPIREATRHLRERQLRVFASALVLRGREPARFHGLADLIALDAYKEGLRFFLERQSGSSSRTIEDLALSLRTAAKYWVKADATTLLSMNAIVRALSIKRRGMTAKNRERLRPLEDPRIRYALVSLPPKLMRMAESGKLHPKRAAFMAQFSVALEILLMAPMRMRNLIGLDLDHHFVRPARSEGALHIIIPGQEVKNRTELDYPLPEESAALIGRYLEQFRPLLASPENRALFPGAGAGPKTDHTLTRQIVKTVFRYVGLRVNPHLFRHIAVKLHLDRHPGEHAIVTHALGNRSMDMTALHYAGLETAAAVRYFDETVQSLRRRKLKP